MRYATKLDAALVVETEISLILFYDRVLLFKLQFCYVIDFIWVGYSNVFGGESAHYVV